MSKKNKKNEGTEEKQEYVYPLFNTHSWVWDGQHWNGFFPEGKLNYSMNNVLLRCNEYTDALLVAYDRSVEDGIYGYTKAFQEAAQNMLYKNKHFAHWWLCRFVTDKADAIWNFVYNEERKKDGVKDQAAEKEANRVYNEFLSIFK